MRLAAFWLLYMGGMGLVFPYQSLYFRENVALAGTQLGILLAVRPLVGIAAQPFFGQLADRTGARGPVLALLCVGAAIGLLGIPFVESFPLLLLAFAFASLFSTAVIPISTSVSMAALGSDVARRFGRVRVWGTLGFLACVVGFPPVLDRLQAQRGLVAQPGGPSEPGLGALYLLAAALTLVAGAVAWRLPRGGSLVLRAKPGDVRRLLRHPPYRRALLFSFLAFFFLQGPILLFPLLVRARGGDLDTLSALWIPMLALEVPLVLFSGATLRRLGARGLLATGVLADAVRWLGSALIPDLRVVFALQLLHGVVVAGLILGIQLYVEASVPERLRSTGQSLVTMVGPSLGGVLSSVGAGFLLEHVGTTAPYLAGGSAALVLGLATWWLLPVPARQAAAQGEARA